MKNYTLDQLLGGLRTTESSGRYDAMGPITKSGDRAYGAYQVMGNNIPNWTKEVLGNPMTPQQFLSDQKAQDAVARAKFGGYLQNGSAQDAISMWFSGRPLAQAGNASDGYMKTPDYVNRVLSYAENQQPSGPPGMVASDAQQQPLQEQTLVPGTQQEDRYSGVGPALANIGSIVAGLDRHRNQGLVAGLANTADNLVAQQRLNQQNNGWDVAGFNDDKTGVLLRNKQTGEIKIAPTGSGFGGEKLQYKGLDTDKNGQTYDTFANSKGELIRKPTDMVDPAMKAQEKLDEGDASFWGQYVMSNPAALSQIPRNVRSQVMSSVRKEAEDAGFGGKDLFQTLQKNATDIVDYKKRAGIIANLDTYKGEFLSAAKQATEYSKDLERKFGAVPLEKLTQWAEANSGSPDAVKINNLKVALEGLSRSANRAFTTASGGNVTGEQRLTQLFNPSMPHNMIVGGIGVLTKDVLRLNQNAQWALQNQRARNGGKPLPHPEIDNEEAALKDILGGYEDKGSGKTTIRDTGAPAGVPKSGEVVDGYRFKGGDPSKKESWEKM